jgi:hypothetical protein
VGIREDAIYGLAQAKLIPDSRQNRPMRQNVINSFQRIVVATEPPPAPVLQSLTIAPTTVSLNVGQNQQFTAAAVWSDGSTTLPALTWSASGGVITQTGYYVAGQVAGPFTVTTEGGEKQASATVTISIPPLPPPDDLGVLLDDNFADGTRHPGNGVSFMWASAGANDGDRVYMEPGAMVGTFGGNVSLLDDAWAECGNYRLAEPLLEGFVGMDLETDAAYFHRNCWDAALAKHVSPSNNKLLVIWGGIAGASRDESYQNPYVVFGLHNLAWLNGESQPQGNSKLVVGWGTQAGGISDHGTGPWFAAMKKGPNRIMLGTYFKVGTFVAAADATHPGVGNTGLYGNAIQTVWVNRQAPCYDKHNLPVWKAGNVGVQYFYLPGWANSGFNVTTEFRIHRLVVSRKPHPDWLPV